MTGVDARPTRRRLLTGATALGLARAAPAAAEDASALADLERRHGGRLGVFAQDVGSGATFAHRADERFLLCSTFKGVLAACVLARVDAGRDRLDARVPYGARDLVEPSPVARAHLAEGALSVEALCLAVLHVSDNAAANLLLARVGGPPALTAYARSLGDRTSRFDRYEPEAGRRSGDKDTTTPRAIATTARTLLLGEALRPASRALLERGMAQNSVGLHRLRAGLPADWAVADRTGTGAGECNDYALVRRPGRPPLVVAAYYDAPGLDTPAQEAVLRQVGAAVAAWAR